MSESQVSAQPTSGGWCPVTCVNLLRSAPGKSETILTEHFRRGAMMAQAVGVPVAVVDFDWHGTIRTLGEEEGVEEYWAVLEDRLRGTGFTCGLMHGDVVSVRRRQREVCGRRRGHCAVNSCRYRPYPPKLSLRPRSAGVGVPLPCCGRMSLR